MALILGGYFDGFHSHHQLLALQNGGPDVLYAS